MRRLLAAGLLCILLLTTSCSAGLTPGAAVVSEQATATAPAATSPTIAAPTACLTEAPTGLPWATVFETTPLAPIDPGTPYTGKVATPKQSGTIVFTEPTTCSTPVAALPKDTLNGPTTLPVIGKKNGWVNVLLPSRRALPSEGKGLGSVNHASGWIQKAAVELAAAPLEIVVDQAAGAVTLMDGGREVYRAVIEMDGGADTVAGRTFVVGVYKTSASEQCSEQPMIVMAAQSESMDEYFDSGASVQALHGFSLGCKLTLLSGQTPGCTILADADVAEFLRLGVGAGTVVTVH